MKLPDLLVVLEIEAFQEATNLLSNQVNLNNYNNNLISFEFDPPPMLLRQPASSTPSNSV